MTDTASPQPIYAGKRIYDLLSEHMAAVPDREAVVDGAVRLTYGELSLRVDKLAKGLIAAGVEPGDRVAIMTPPALEFWLTYLAATSIGAIWMGLNPRYQKPEYAYLLGDAEPRIVFVRSPYDGRDYVADLAEAGPKVERFVRVDELDSFAAQGQPVADDLLASRRAAVHPDDTAVIVYTSGTTGQPKGAMLSHRAIVAAALINRDWMGEGLECTICAAPINHVGALNNVCMNVFAAGGRIVFHHRVDLAEIAQLSIAERPTYLVASPTTFVMFAQNPAAGLEALGRYKLLVFGGGTTPEPLIAPVAATGIKMANVYGQTETVGIVTATAFGDTPAVMAETFGKPLPYCQLRIGRADGSEAGVGETGEIQVKGPLTMSGYFRREQASREAFTGDGWLRTGDLGLKRPDGNFSFVGRLKEMYKSGGYNVYPAEIENALAEHPKVAVAAVLPVRHELYREVGHAFIVPVAGTELKENELKEFLRERLANYKIPKSFSFEPALPLLPSSKIDRMALKRRLQSEETPA
ncbi:AMP-binding protein [Sphingomonas arenae]|uniref:AMP-binding protein n=1 Tax=Sphingomonas arenae TaxID=2812555 RepID=UPI001967666F